MDTTATLYWAPVVPNGAVGVQGVAEIAFLWDLLGPTSRKTIRSPTAQ